MQRMNLLFTLKLILRGWGHNKLFFAVPVVSFSVGLACANGNGLLDYFVHDYFMEQNIPIKTVSLLWLMCLVLFVMLSIARSVWAMVRENPAEVIKSE